MVTLIRGIPNYSLLNSILINIYNIYFRIKLWETGMDATLDFGGVRFPKLKINVESVWWFLPVVRLLFQEKMIFCTRYS